MGPAHIVAIRAFHSMICKDKKLPAGWHAFSWANGMVRRGRVRLATK
jgi:hypothetical protein